VKSEREETERERKTEKKNDSGSGMAYAFLEVTRPPVWPKLDILQKQST